MAGNVARLRIDVAIRPEGVNALDVIGAAQVAVFGGDFPILADVAVPPNGRAGEARGFGHSSILMVQRQNFAFDMARDFRRGAANGAFESELIRHRGECSRFFLSDGSRRWILSTHPEKVFSRPLSRLAGKRA